MNLSCPFHCLKRLASLGEQFFGNNYCSIHSFAIILLYGFALRFVFAWSSMTLSAFLCRFNSDDVSIISNSIN